MLAMRLFSILFFLAAECAFATDIKERETKWTVGQTVKTTSGPVSGHASANDSQVSEYLGIPFAQAPVKDLRFAAPVAFNGTSPLNGSAFGYSCPVSISSISSVNAFATAAANITVTGVQILQSLGLVGSNVIYNEDCLYLNVWTKPQTGEAKKAVLVWIYGGGFSEGTSSFPAYNGANLASLEDVVVVSFNYRLGVLGFPGSPSGTNNLGLLDQRMAVEWVRDNIEKFGGDPSRITLFGQSAGGASVDLYSYAWASDPVAAGFIPESGTAFSWGLPRSKALAAKGWFNVSTSLGCGDASTDPATVLSCMRKWPYSSIVETAAAFAGTLSVLSGFAPTIDDKVVFSNYSLRTPAKVPLLLGNNDYEAGLFRTQFALAGVFLPDVYWTDFNLKSFTCPAGIRANASIKAGVPTWRYRYFGVFPDLQLSSEAGAWHGSEIPLIFNTRGNEATQAEISIGNYLRGAWAAFAKDPTNGLSKYGWPKYDTSEDSLIRLAYNNLTGTNVINPYRYDADCVFFNVTSTNSSYPTLPDLGANVEPTSSVGGTGTATGTGPGATSSKKSVAGRIEVWWSGLGVVALALALMYLA